MKQNSWGDMFKD